MKHILLIIFFSPAIFAAEGFATYYTVASCQREGTSGVYTCNGEKYDETAMTCALRINKSNKDFGKKWRVTNPDTGKSVIVRQNDFGPAKAPAAKGVIIDLTPAAFEAVGGKKKAGRVKIIVEEVK